MTETFKGIDHAGTISDRDLTAAVGGQAMATPERLIRKK
jgi:hypothetical protein